MNGKLFQPQIGADQGTAKNHLRTSGSFAFHFKQPALRNLSHVADYDAETAMRESERRRTEGIPQSVPGGRDKLERFHAIARVALRKLIQMNRAARLSDLRIPPGNRLEALKGDLSGLHSIRINQQWRILFCWTERGPAKVWIVDYH